MLPGDERTLHGVAIPPASVPRPPDGYYWVRLASARFVCIGTGDGSFEQSYRYTWEQPVLSVHLVELRDGNTDWMGSDEADDLENNPRVLVEVIAKIEEPAPACGAPAPAPALARCGEPAGHGGIHIARNATGAITNAWVLPAYSPSPSAD